MSCMHSNKKKSVCLFDAMNLSTSNKFAGYQDSVTIRKIQNTVNRYATIILTQMSQPSSFLMAVLILVMLWIFILCQLSGPRIRCFVP